MTWDFCRVVLAGCVATATRSPFAHVIKAWRRVVDSEPLLRHLDTFAIRYWSLLQVANLDPAIRLAGFTRDNPMGTRGGRRRFVFAVASANAHSSHDHLPCSGRRKVRRHHGPRRVRYSDRSLVPRVQCPLSEPQSRERASVARSTAAAL